jgi:hypothetical protein
LIHTLFASAEAQSCIVGSCSALAVINNGSQGGCRVLCAPISALQHHYSAGCLITTAEIDEVTPGMLFPPGEAAGVIDERTRSAATRLARDHGCRFLFDGHSSRSTFLKLPGRWHALIDNLCTDLGREMPGTEDFRINIDHKISEAEARASDSEAIPFGETPKQRRREFQQALRKILREGQNRDSSNKKVWTEALHLLDNPRVRVASYERPNDSPKR